MNSFGGLIPGTTGVAVTNCTRPNSRNTAVKLNDRDIVDHPMTMWYSCRGCRRPSFLFHRKTTAVSQAGNADSKKGEAWQTGLRGSRPIEKGSPCKESGEAFFTLSPSVLRLVWVTMTDKPWRSFPTSLLYHPALSHCLTSVPYF